nr:hypothetical protein [Tanacetum cinerariifolium]
VANLSSYPSQHFNSCCYDDDDDDEDYTIAITPDFSITDSLSMGDEYLSTISEIKSDEFIKSSVENLVQNPSESKDECDCDFDSLLKEFFGELAHIDLIPSGINEANCDPEEEIHLDSDPFMEKIDLFLTSDGSIPLGIDSDYSDSEGDNLFPKRLLHDDPIPLPDTLDFSNVI